jgi:hypothetical protein
MQPTGRAPSVPAAHHQAHHRALLRPGCPPGPAAPRPCRAPVAARVFQQQQQQPSSSSQVILPAGAGSIVVPSKAQQQQLVSASGGSLGSAGGSLSSSDEAKKPFRISWAGSGIYFWWQLGALQYLSKRYDLTRVPHGGASGGALAAALARCGVDPEEITESAYRLSLEHKIWERPLGLVGVWGSIIEKWLDELLPADAAERCRGACGVVVTQLPSCRQVWIDEFEDKADLINCVMASAHVPILLDLQLSRRCRGAPCLDGSFPDFFTGANCDHIQVRLVGGAGGRGLRAARRIIAATCGSRGSSSPSAGD